MTSLLITLIIMAGLAGDWVGGSDLFGNAIQITAQFTSADAGQFTSKEWSVFRRRMTNVRVQGSDVHFEFPSSTGEAFVADGKIDGDVISGTIRRGTQSGKFHLRRMATIDPATYDPLVGIYQVAANRNFVITWSGWGNLRLVDTSNGVSVPLYPTSDSTYIIGPNLISSTVSQQIVTFRKSGDVASTLVFRQGSDPEKLFPRVEGFKQEKVSFRNGAVTLGGTLLVPPTSGKHPAVVYHEGSGDWTRDDMWYSRPIDVFLNQGVAVLLYDKRGDGESSDDWHYAKYDDLAGDLLAGVKFLQHREEIDAKRIGVRGFSQGGWIVSLAAARSKDIAWVIYESAAAGGTIEAQDTKSLLDKMRADGFAESEIEDARKFVALTYAAPKSDVAWKTFEAALPSARAQKWFPRTIGGLPRDAWVWQQRRLNASYDPALAFEKIKQPILIVFGEKDNPGESIARIEAALKRAGNKDFTIKVFPGANHNLEVEQDGKAVWAQGHFDLLREWTGKRIQ